MDKQRDKVSKKKRNKKMKEWEVMIWRGNRLTLIIEYQGILRYGKFYAKLVFPHFLKLKLMVEKFGNYLFLQTLSAKFLSKIAKRFF